MITKKKKEEEEDLAFGAPFMSRCDLKFDGALFCHL